MLHCYTQTLLLVRKDWGQLSAFYDFFWPPFACSRLASQWGNEPGWTSSITADPPVAIASTH